MLVRASCAAALVVCALAGGRLWAESAPSAWLARVNYYRSTASLPSVVEDPALSLAVSRHAHYMVKHGVVKHSEHPGERWATPEGAAAAAASNLAGSTSQAETDEWAVDLWMQAPFHALGILDPALERVGYAIDHEGRGRIQTAAGLDVLHGRAAEAHAAYPITWPANGATIPITTHISEYPDPLASCPGYSAPAGLPLIVQMGSGLGVPRVTGSWITDGERWLEHCTFDESTYRNRDAAQQTLGRSILAARDAIVLIPRAPLRNGVSYRAGVDVDGRVVDWRFSVRAE